MVHFVPMHLVEGGSGLIDTIIGERLWEVIARGKRASSKKAPRFNGSYGGGLLLISYGDGGWQSPSPYRPWNLGDRNKGSLHACMAVAISTLVGEVLIGELSGSRVCIMRATSEDQFIALSVRHIGQRWGERLRLIRSTHGQSVGSEA